MDGNIEHTHSQEDLNDSLQNLPDDSPAFASASRVGELAQKIGGDSAMESTVQDELAFNNPGGGLTQLDTNIDQSLLLASTFGMHGSGMSINLLKSATIDHTEKRLAEIAPKIWEDEAQRAERLPMLRKVLTESSYGGLDDFYTEYKAARVEMMNGDNTKLVALEKRLMAGGLMFWEIEKLKSTTDQDAAGTSEYMQSLNDITILSTIVTQAEEDENVDEIEIFNAVQAAAQAAAARGEDATQAARAALQREVARLALTNSAFQELNNDLIQQEKVNRMYMAAISVDFKPKAAVRSSPADLSVEAAPHFAALSPEVQEGLAQMMEQGGMPIVEDMLLQGVQETDNGLVGNMSSGPQVLLSNADGLLYIIGEHAGEAARNPIPDPYPVDPPTVNNFNEQHRFMIVKENGVASLAKPGYQNALMQVAEAITGESQNKGVLMSADGANRLHNFIVLALGGVPEDVELARMEETGILSSAQGFVVNYRRIEKMSIALEQYTPRRLDGRMTHQKMAIDYNHFATLAKLWDHSGDDRKLPPYEELVQLTDAVEKAEDPRVIFDEYLGGTNPNEILAA